MPPAGAVIPGVVSKQFWNSKDPVAQRWFEFCLFKKWIVLVRIPPQSEGLQETLSSLIQLCTPDPILGILLVMILMWCTVFSSTCQFKLNITASSGSESATEIAQLLQHSSTEEYRNFFLLQSQNRSLICKDLSPPKENNLLSSSPLPVPTMKTKDTLLNTE